MCFYCSCCVALLCVLMWLFAAAAGRRSWLLYEGREYIQGSLNQIRMLQSCHTANACPLYSCVCVSILCAGRPSFSFHFMTFDCVPLKNRHVCHCSFLIFSPFGFVFSFFHFSIKELYIFTLHSVGNFDNLCTMKLKINSTWFYSCTRARSAIW